MNDKLKELLHKYRYKKFLVIEQGGNHGDKLIYMGMEKILNELSITYNKVNLPEKETIIYKFLLIVGKDIKRLTKKFTYIFKKIDTKIYRVLNRKIMKKNHQYEIILINGGGNINEIYHFGLRLLEDVIKNYQDKILIIAPQTFWFNKIHFPNFFENIKNEVHLFCREKYSYKLLKSMIFPKNVKLYLSHDTSLYLSKDDFNPRLSSTDLLCLRTDIESAIIFNYNNLRKVEKKIIIEDICRHLKFEDFLDRIETSRRVYTDRLHVAILSTILGKDTTLFTNSYYKNKGVYEYSLSKYPNIKFIEDINEIKNLINDIVYS